MMHGFPVDEISGRAGAAVASEPQAGRAAADFPVTFDGTIGLYSIPDAKAPVSDVAVLFVSSWGFEELCSRKFWRLLAEELGQSGIASLRFDYPGTGDALDLDNYDGGIDIWLRSIMSAAAVLRDLSGTSRLLLVGHGIGAALAWRAAEAMKDVTGIAMAAPALSGRHWVREFAALSRLIDYGEFRPSTSLAVGEDFMPDAILAGIRGLDISKATTSPAPDVFVVYREARSADLAFAEHLSSLGVRTQTTPFEGYDQFISAVLYSVPPRTVIHKLADWARSFQGASRSQTLRGPREDQTLAGDGFTERPVRFGTGSRLYGILSEPRGPHRGPTVMILSTGYDRMSGWGRITARICRGLAQAGIPAFRFDVANISDSPPYPGAPDQILYSDSQMSDVAEAMTFLEARGRLPIIVSGRCSGAYTAFKSAVRFKSINAVVVVNLYDFALPPNADVEKIIRTAPQPLAMYGDRMRSGGFWRRVLRGEVDIPRGLRKLTSAALVKSKARIVPFFMRFPLLSRRLNPVAQEIKLLTGNGVELSFVYSSDSIGMSNLEVRFGKQGYLLPRYGKADIKYVKVSDQKLMTGVSRQLWQDEIQRVALRLGASGLK